MFEGIYFILLMAMEVPVTSSSDCDLNREQESEGNVGESALFPWLGVLKVHIHEEDSVKIALTGLVLIKRNYALANADDISRVPKRIFQQDSKAMFIAKAGVPWLCRPVDYMTHPEYQYSTVNTIAVVELHPGDERFPMKPICWPSYFFNTSNELYAIGFTDENKMLEKSIFSMQYVSQKICKEFYTREGLTDSMLSPSHLHCASGRRLRESCIWDNGMLLASNSSGHWTLVGFGVRGPGCTAPARFIDLLPYLPWIETATNLEIPDQGYRKTAFNEGFRRQGDAGPNEADHLTEIHLSPDSRLLQEKWPFDTEAAQDQYFVVDQLEKDAINIRDVSVPGWDGDCTLKTLRQVYRDETRVVVKHNTLDSLIGSIQYKVSMYDLRAMNYSCAKISLKSTRRQDKCKIYYRTVLDHREGAFGETPDDLLHIYPIKKVEGAENKTKPEEWEPGPHLKPSFIQDKELSVDVDNYNILVTFEFEREGIIEVQVLGPMYPITSPRPTTKNLRRRRFEHPDVRELHTNGDHSTNGTVIAGPGKIDANYGHLKRASDSFGGKLAASIKHVALVEVFVLGYMYF